MNDILTYKGTRANKSQEQNNGRFAVFATTLLFAMFSSQALANRPAMDERSSVSIQSEAVTPAAVADEAPDHRPEVPSSVDLIMQNQGQQTTGDVVQLPAKEMQPGETLRIQLLDYPRRGMSMDNVQNEYGQPITISDSVGKPPITRWTYNDRVVYFEYSTVLHVVAR